MFQEKKMSPQVKWLEAATGTLGEYVELKV